MDRFASAREGGETEAVLVFARHALPNVIAASTSGNALPKIFLRFQRCHHMARIFFILWLAFILPGCIKDPRESVIAIQPIDKFDQALMDSIAPTLNKVYGYV